MPIFEMLQRDAMVMVNNLLPLPPVGQSVTLVQDYEFDHTQLIRAHGSSHILVGKVIVSTRILIIVKFNKPVDGLEHYDNRVIIGDTQAAGQKDGSESDYDGNDFTWPVVMNFHRLFAY